MTQNIHCPMIHGGLQIELKKHNQKVFAQHCCLRNNLFEVDPSSNIWNNEKFIPLRNTNLNNEWDPGCWTCQGNELSGLDSFRLGTLNKFGIQTDLSGPKRLDLMFDISCNLACRTCGPHSSTYWQRHLKENKIEFESKSPISRADDMINILKNLDLSNLELVVFCGGETLMGEAYWQIADTIAELVHNANEKITLSFQTNGTQPIKEKYFKIIEKFQLVKLNISLDGINHRFNYLRWPADWDQVVENIFGLNATLPVNVMFLIEETMSIFNLYYQHELDTWAKNNFSINRLGDKINHTRHIADGLYSPNNLTREYVDAISKTNLINLINPAWQENSEEITAMIAEIQKFDAIREQNWTKTFPEVADFYSRYLR